MKPMSLQLNKETLKVLGASATPSSGLWTTTTTTTTGGITRAPICGPTR